MVERQTGDKTRAHFDYVMKWLEDERPYQKEKFDYDEQARRLERDPTKEVEFWIQQFSSYMQRLPILSLDTPQGRQAAAKFVATTTAFLETIVKVYGPLPEPGVQSGENINTLRPIPFPQTEISE